ncbi:MAG: UDP-N-acetylenolpyruvoylglucosamine reductase [Fimbriimonadaceae bacterium]|nr:UDP-N-acetylenolpyruvoylglucosamine reductase [Fimbriimonadaceae bacterium]
MSLASTLPGRLKIRHGVSLAPLTTLRAGGPAEWLVSANSTEELAMLAQHCHRQRLPLTVLGWGSNVLPSDHGVAGLTVVNRSTVIDIREDGTVDVDTGASFQELFLKCAQAKLGGFEYAVGIPGTVGGALVSNAGAYRSQISEFLIELDVVDNGVRKRIPPLAMNFAYRDSILRTTVPPPLIVLRATFRLAPREPKAIYDEAREYQRQRIGKQPPPASAGSFFKNVSDPDLAQRLRSLPVQLREAGVVPAGFLIMESGLPGQRLGGAMISRRHANFILNVSNASAGDIRSLAELAKRRVSVEFGVTLEEEVLYLGDWSRWGGHEHRFEE